MWCYNKLRFRMAAIIFFSTLTAYHNQATLNVALVFMSNASKYIVETNGSTTTASDICLEELTQRNYSLRSWNRSEEKNESNYEWDETTQGAILTSFYYPFLIMHLPAGMLLDRYGPRFFVGNGLLFSGLLTLITPVVADCLPLFLLTRAMMGMAQALIFPGAIKLISRWIPPNEQSTVISLAWVGVSLGTILASSLTGFLCEHLGWEFAFYLSGVMAAFVGIVYLIVVTNNPLDCSSLSTAELKHIQEHIRTESCLSQLMATSLIQQPQFPWYPVMTSASVWSLIMVKFTNSLAFSFAAMKLVSYMCDVQRVSVETAGNCISAIFSMVAISNLLAGVMADYILRSGVFPNRAIVRKLFQTFASMGIAIAFFMLPATECNSTAFFLVCLTGFAMIGLETGGNCAVITDLTIEHSATLYSITEVITTCASLSPQVYGLLLDANPGQLKHTWWAIFNFIGAANVFGAVIFVFFGSAERQHWDKDRRKSSPDREMITYDVLSFIRMD